MEVIKERLVYNVYQQKDQLLFITIEENTHIHDISH